MLQPPTNVPTGHDDLPFGVPRATIELVRTWLSAMCPSTLAYNNIDLKMSALFSFQFILFLYFFSLFFASKSRNYVIIVQYTRRAAATTKSQITVENPISRKFRSGVSGQTLELQTNENITEQK